MTTSKHIRYVPRHEIDTARWDACIDEAANSLIYGFHFYLDHMAAGQWDALILGDYEAVMPLTWRSKFGIRYLYQPAFTQQTGIFSATPPDNHTIGSFLQTAQRSFRFSEINLNYQNNIPGLKPLANYILPLNSPYENLAANYRGDLRRNLKFALRSSLDYSVDLDLEMTLEGYRREYGARTPHVRSNTYNQFAALCRYCRTRDQLILRAAATAAGEIRATALLLRDRHRLYLLQSTTPKAGREVEANRFLLDGIIREFAAQPLLLDFEGSEIPGIAHFYATFGAVDQPYYFYRHNNLPWPLRWLKK